MTDIKLIYDGKPEDFNWVGFGSCSGTNLRECAKVIKPSAVFSDKPSAKLLQLAELSDVEKIVLNGFKECGSWKMAKGNPDMEADYWARSAVFNQKIVDELHRHEDKIDAPIDLIVLGGYMRLVGDVLLEAYEDKIINVHPANLSLVTYEGNTFDLSYDEGYSDVSQLFDSGLDAKPVERKFIGEDAVYDAIKAGQRKTCSSVIMVNNGIDNGEIITTGPEVEVWDEYLNGTLAERAGCLREYADAHQSMQKVRSDWPALTMALKLISEGRVGLGPRDADSVGAMHFKEWRKVFLEGKYQRYDGCFVNYATQKADLEFQAQYGGK